MENSVCLFCRRADYRVLYDGLRDLLTEAPGQFRLVICNECQLIYLNPRPTAAEIAIYYPDNYEPFLKMDPRAMKPLQRWFLNHGLRKRATPILNHKTQGRVLDIGCATGQYLDYIKSHSRWGVYGVELDTGAAEFAQKELGLNVYIGELESACFPNEYFDAVTMWDVLEHLPNPHETLIEIRRILKPDGLLLFRVPFLNSLDAKLFGQYWAGLDVPRHFYVFSQKTLFKLLTGSGFRPIRHWNISGSFFVFVLSLQFWLEDQFGVNNIITTGLKLLRSIPVRLLVFPYFFLIDQFNLGPEIAVLSKKDFEELILVRDKRFQ